MIKFAPRLDVFDQQASKWFQMVLNDSELFPCFVEKLRTKQYRFWRPAHFTKSPFSYWIGIGWYPDMVIHLLRTSPALAPFKTPSASPASTAACDRQRGWKSSKTFRMSGCTYTYITSFNPSPIGTLLCLWESIFPLDSLGAFEIMRTTSTWGPHVVGDAEKDIKSRGT